MNIQVETKGPKAYLAKVVGLSERYGVEVEFLTETKKVSATYKIYTITEPGIYKHIPREAVALSMRRDTGFIRVNDDSTVTEITLADAQAAVTTEAK